MPTRTNCKTGSVMIIGAFMIFFFSYGEPATPTYFDVSLPAGGIFDNIASFQTPTGPTGLNPDRKTIARIVTPTLEEGIRFEIAPPPGSGKTPVELTVDGAIRVIAVGATVVANVVRAQLISDEPGNPVAEGFAMIRITIAYDPAFDFGGVAETWVIRAKQLEAERRYMGFVHTGEGDVDGDVTRPKLQITESALLCGDVQEGSTANVPTDRSTNTPRSARP